MRKRQRADGGDPAPKTVRTLWKGAISFGLVHVPVGLYSATADSGIDFDWLDRRTMQPVGYRRINKVTGKDVPRDAIVRSGRAGIARVLIQAKQHLAILVPCGPARVLNLLRWGGEIRPFEALDLPPAGLKANGIRETELTMAGRLIDEMTQDWQADDLRNSFADEIRRLVEAKAGRGDVEDVVRPEEGGRAGKGKAEPAGAEVVDLSALLRRSLSAGGRRPRRGERASGERASGERASA